MWLESELSRLNGLFSSVQQPAIETILKTEDLASIQNLTSIELAGLRNGLLIPKVKKLICWLEAYMNNF